MSEAPAQSLLSSYQTSIESFCESILASYVAELKPDVPPRSPKEFNDPVWGTIVLFPLELVLLDSPLVQRLRRIRQLGVVHWIYPSANHTRFEHSLGVVQQADRLIKAINFRKAHGDFIDEQHARLLRVAALVHDIGHGMFSHVSEKALENFPETETLKLEFQDKIKVDRISLSEMAAYYMIGSPSFEKLLERAQAVTNEYFLPDGSAQRIQNVVVGLGISEEFPLLHELISGPFDADKLDYMARDAFMSGVPVVTDVSRLIQKVRAQNVSQHSLPPELGRTVEGGHASYTVVGIDRSGGRTLDELMLGRTLLYDKIYRHQKVRAAEAMLASIFVQIAGLIAERPTLFPFSMTDDELLSMDVHGLRRLKGARLTQRHLQRVNVAIGLAHQLQRRELFVRAFAFAQSMPLDPYRAAQGQQAGLERLIREASDQEARRFLTKMIADEVVRILRTLGESDLLRKFEQPDLLPFIWIDPPRPTAEAGDISRAYLIGEDGTLTRFKDDYAQTKGWTDAYLLTRDIGYVFAPRELAPFVYLAAEKIVRERFSVRIPTPMLDYAKQDKAKIADLRRGLSSAGYYDRTPHDLRPIPMRLTRADIGGLVESILARLRGYSGPVLEHDDESAGALEAGHVLNWVRQFESDSFIDAALTVLEKTQLIGRTEIVEALTRFMEGHQQFRDGNLCTLGTPKDSSGIITYYSGDVAEKYGLKLASSLADALATGAPIIFVDDFISSGQQAVSIIEAWLGAPATVELGEARGDALIDSLKTSLRERSLGFVFSAGSEEGRERLQSRAAELGLSATVEIGIPEASLPRAFGQNHFRNVNQEREFKAMCKKIGEDLLTTTGVHDIAWARKRALGYGNHAYLVAFPYNTPSQTLTCLWAAGHANGIDWAPLLPRRKKI